MALSLLLGSIVHAAAPRIPLHASCQSHNQSSQQNARTIDEHIHDSSVTAEERLQQLRKHREAKREQNPSSESRTASCSKRSDQRQNEEAGEMPDFLRDIGLAVQ